MDAGKKGKKNPQTLRLRVNPIQGELEETNEWYCTAQKLSSFGYEYHLFPQLMTAGLPRRKEVL
ncbi:hypothetical protein [Noviherbaspirillum aridicola]|nr:hypothetical protein [Noviherbaspirillum aridicola]